MSRLLWMPVVVALSLVPALAFGSGVAGAQTSTPTLAGEGFNANSLYPNSTFTLDQVTCSTTGGPSSFSYAATGTVSPIPGPGFPTTPPLPGNFVETGTATFAGTSGPALLNATFMITDSTTGTVLATGTKTSTGGFSGGGPTPDGSVHPGCVPASSPPQVLAEGPVAYSVTFASGGTELGTGFMSARNLTTFDDPTGPGGLAEGFVGPRTAVTGTVTGPGGIVFQPPTIVGVAACPANVPLAQNCPGFATTAADPSHGGSYVLNLSPGSYNVVGYAFFNGRQLATSNPVQVTLGQGQTITENFIVTPPPPPVPGIVTGNVTLSGPVPAGTTYGVVMCLAQFNTTCAITSPAYMTVTPNSGLFDGEIVSLSGTGPSGGGTTVRECAPATGCDFTTSMAAFALPDGTVGPVDFTVHQHINAAVGTGGPTVPVDCAVSPCEIEFYNGGPTPNGGGAPISFAGGVNAAHPSSPFAFADPSGHYSLSQGFAAPFVVQGFALIGGDLNRAITTAPVVVTLVPGQTITQDFVIAVPISFGKTITMGPQAMEGDLKVAPGSTLQVGYDFTMPGSHPAASVTFVGAQVVFQATCVSGTGGGTITVPMNDQTYQDAANSSAWYPSGDQKSATTYQGSVTVPDVCNGGLVRLQKGGTFSAGVTSTDKTDKVNIRWHYRDGTDAGGWSGTLGVVPS